MKSLAVKLLALVTIRRMAEISPVACAASISRCTRKASCSGVSDAAAIPTAILLSLSLRKAVSIFLPSARNTF